MIAAEAEVATTVPEFAHARSHFHGPVVYTGVQYQHRSDPILGDDAIPRWLAARAAVIWRDFGSPSRLPVSDWIDDARIYSPEDEPYLATRWKVFLASLNQPTSEESEQVLNWDFAIEAEPKRPKGKIRVKLQFAGRDKPLPEEDPWAT